MSDSYQKGKDAFESGFYCAESVLKAIAEEDGISSELLPGIATRFCGGMSRTCNMCGAVTGGILALNIVYGRKTQNDTVEKNYAAVQKLISRFEKFFGTVNCQDLLGCDLGTKEGQAIFKNANLHKKCIEYTGKATELTRCILDGDK